MQQDTALERRKMEKSKKRDLGIPPCCLAHFQLTRLCCQSHASLQIRGNCDGVHSQELYPPPLQPHRRPSSAMASRFSSHILHRLHFRRQRSKSFSVSVMILRLCHFPLFFFFLFPNSNAGREPSLSRGHARRLSDSSVWIPCSLLPLMHVSPKPLAPKHRSNAVFLYRVTASYTEYLLPEFAPPFWVGKGGIS